MYSFSHQPLKARYVNEYPTAKYRFFSSPAFISSIVSSMPTMQLLLNLLLGLYAYVIYALCARWRKLSNVPGPFLAKFTDLWAAWYQYNGWLRPKLIELHAQQGPLVRYGPRSISVSDPSVIDVVYGSRAGFLTVSVAQSIPWFL
jgi:hypothetical protein